MRRRLVERLRIFFVERVEKQTDNQAWRCFRIQTDAHPLLCCSGDQSRRPIASPAGLATKSTETTHLKSQLIKLDMDSMKLSRPRANIEQIATTIDSASINFPIVRRMTGEGRAPAPGKAANARCLRVRRRDQAFISRILATSMSRGGSCRRQPPRPCNATVACGAGSFRVQRTRRVEEAFCRPRSWFRSAAPSPSRRRTRLYVHRFPTDRLCSGATRVVSLWL